MHKIIIGALLFVLLVAGPAESQEEFVFYLPLIAKPPLGVIPMAGNWSAIEKEITINLIENPSFELGTTGWTSVVGAMAQDAAQQERGAYSLMLTPAASVVGAYNTCTDTTVASTEYTASGWFYSVATAVTVRIRFWDAGAGFQDTTMAIAADTWARVTATETFGVGAVRRIYFGAAAGVLGPDVFYIDACQLEQKSYSTTYVDGDQEGCEWNGAEHASTSTRSAVSLAGGRVRELEVVYSFFVDKMVQIGVEPLALAFDEYAILPGGELNAIKSEMREFVLAGTITGTSLADLHVNRQALLEVLRPDVPGGQPIRLWYDGAAIEKEIKCYYVDGLDGDIQAQETGIEARERIAVRFIAADPFFYEIGESAAALDSNDAPVLRYLAGRLRSTGLWSGLGLGAALGPAGTWCVYVASDKSVYFGGGFTGLGGVAGRDYLARYDPAAGTWSTVGPANEFNAQIWCIIEGPNGDIYVGGDFTDGAGNKDHIARWDGTNWNAMGNPLAGTAAITRPRAFAFDSLGNLYVGGDFLNWAGIVLADGFVEWTAAGAWVAVGAPAITAICYALAIDSNDNIYLGGTFINLGGVGAADNLGMWNGTAYSAVGGVTPSSGVEALVVDKQDRLFIGGNFIDLAGISNADRIAMWDGIAFYALGTGLTAATCRTLAIAPDDTLFVGGLFTNAGNIVGYGLARWNGEAWAYIDVDTPGATGIRQIDCSEADPVVPRLYNVYLAFSTTGAAEAAGAATVANDGTVRTFPRIQISRSGGTTANIRTIRNDTTGKELMFNYALLNGESLTIYLEPTQKRIISSFFGERPHAILQNSDFGEFSLIPGDNIITALIAVTGGPTITANIIYKDAYASLD